jgi:dipeptide/tripeptide permease
MVIGLLIYLKAGPWLPPDNRPQKRPHAKPREPMSRSDWLRVLAVVVLVPVMAVALLTNQEIFNAYLVWADEQFQLTFFGRTIPTTWMITIDAALSFSMLVAVAWFWKWRADKTGSEPDELGKMIIGSGFTIAGGLCLVTAAATQGDAKIGLFWPVMFHLLNSIGFSHILPVSLALFTRLAPRQINATVIGIYYLAFFLANQIVGHVGGWYSTLGNGQLLAVPRRHRGGRAGVLRAVQAVRAGAVPGQGAGGGRGAGLRQGLKGHTRHTLCPLASAGISSAFNPLCPRGAQIGAGTPCPRADTTKPAGLGYASSTMSKSGT